MKASAKGHNKEKAKDNRGIIEIRLEYGKQNSLFEESPIMQKTRLLSILKK